MISKNVLQPFYWLRTNTSHDTFAQSLSQSNQIWKMYMTQRLCVTYNVTCQKENLPRLHPEGHKDFVVLLIGNYLFIVQKEMFCLSLMGDLTVVACSFYAFTKLVFIPSSSFLCVQHLLLCSFKHCWKKMVFIVFITTKHICILNGSFK